MLYIVGPLARLSTSAGWQKREGGGSSRARGNVPLFIRTILELLDPCPLHLRGQGWGIGDEEVGTMMESKTLKH